MAKNVILMIGDGMGWEMSRAAAIQAEIEREIAQIRQENPNLSDAEVAKRFEGRTLNDYYTEGKGSGTSYQNLDNYAIATTGNTYIAGSKTNSALVNNPRFKPDVFNHNTGKAAVRKDFEFDPSAAIVKGFNPQSISNPDTLNQLDFGVNEAPVLNGDGELAGGNLAIFDTEKGGETPWDDNYYQKLDSPDSGFNKDYIKNLYPDSAGTATGLYTGIKTYVGAVSVDIYEKAIETAGEVALDRDMSIGIVSSVPFNHATPGSAIAHVNHRDKYNARSFDRQVGNRNGTSNDEVDEFGHQVEDRDNIFYQIVNEAKPTVILGGGHYLTNGGTEQKPDEKYITKAEVEKLRQGKYDYTFVERGANASQILAKTASKLDPEAGDRLFGLYGARGQGGNLPWRTANDDYNRVGYSSSLNPHTGGIDVRPPVLEGESIADFVAREVDANPTLKEMTQASLDVLEEDPDGFWLTVEGGDIDWSAHGNDLDNMLGTLKDFDESVAVVRDWIEDNGGYEENFLIVTADHDHYLTLNDNFPEVLAEALLIGKGGVELTANADVATSGHFWGSNPKVKNGWSTHTSRPVPVYFQGADSEIIEDFKGADYQMYNKEVRGVSNFIDQTHLGKAQIEILKGNVSNTKHQHVLGISWQPILILSLLLSLGIGTLLKLRSRPNS